MSIYDSFLTDAELEREGVELDFGDFQVMIARAGGANKRYEQTLRRQLDKHKRAIQLEALPPEAAERILRAVFAETIVLGWKGVEDRDGKEIPFSTGACVKLFEELPEFFYAVREEAAKLGNFLAKRRKDIVGN